MKQLHFKLWILTLYIFLCIIGWSKTSYSVTVLGTGTNALMGDDLTDPDGNGVDGQNLNWDWTSISASSENYWHAEGAYNVFDNKVGASNDKWCCNGPTQWIQVGFSQAYVLSRFTITSGNDVPSRDPDIWKIQGSNDGSNWTDIYVYNNNGTSPWGSTRYQVLLYEGGGVDFNTPAAYSYFRYYVSSIVSGGMHQINEIEFFGQAADTTAPTLDSSTPADNATNIAVDANIVLNFDENVDVESGNITIKKTSDNSTIETIDVTSNQVSGSGGTQITVNPSSNLAGSTEYYVLIDATAFDDSSSNSYAGISSTTALSFTTVDTTAPTLSSSTPADNATNVAVDANIVLTFSETVDTESGNITIKKTSDDSTVETISVTSNQVSGNSGLVMLGGGVSGTVITINPASNFDGSTEYYVLIDSTAFDDTSSNSYAGISSTTALSFTTVDTANPTLSSSTPADNAANVGVSSNIILNFDENVDVESGNITIKRSSDDSIFETINVTSDRVSGTGTSRIVIDPLKNLKVNTSYYLTIAATAFDDATGNSYSGISSKTELNFITKKGRIFNKTVKTLIKNQSAAAINSMSQSMNRVNSRMNFIRPMQNNSFNQNIELAMNYDDPFAERIFDTLAIKYLKPKKETKNWGAWTEGNISFGRIGHRGENLGQDIHSDGLTFGIDKKISDTRTFGIAVSKSWQNTQVGSNEANMEASSTSIMGYGSIKLKEKTYIESAIALGEMEVNLARSVDGGQNKGIRDGRQIYGSFTYLFDPNVKNIVKDNNVNYYSRLDLGYTMLDDYTESGDDDSVFYNDQNVKSATLSLGFNYSKTSEIEKGIITQLFKFEFGRSKTINSLSEAYYINDASTIYANAIADQETSHGQLTLGLGMQLKNDLSLNISFDHYRNNRDTFVNGLNINFRKLF